MSDSLPSRITGMEPFPGFAYEVLFVNNRLAIVGPSRKADGLTPRDVPNDPFVPDGQP